LEIPPIYYTIINPDGKFVIVSVWFLLVDTLCHGAGSVLRLIANAKRSGRRGQKLEIRASNVLRDGPAPEFNIVDEQQQRVTCYPKWSPRRGWVELIL
jgi:hypothetical protein